MPNRELIRHGVSSSSKRRRATIISLAVASGVVGPMASGLAHAVTIVVNATADEDGAGSGCSLREAIKAANSDAAYGGCPAGSGHDEIFVSLAWGQEIAITRGEPLTITSDLMMDLGSTVMRGNGASGAFDVTATANATISFLKITGYSGRIPTVHVKGTLYLDYVWIYDNHTTVVPPQTYGVWVERSGSLYAKNSVFKDNSAIKGGGVFNNGGAAYIETSTFANNTASQYGGAVNTSSGGYTSIDNCTISGNASAQYYGGGVFTGDGSQTDISRSTIVNNRATRGGGIYAATTAETLIWNTIVDGNSASGGSSTNGCSGVVYSSGNNFIGSNTCSLTPLSYPSTDTIGTFAGLGSLAPQWTGGPPVHTPLVNSPVLDKIPSISCGFAWDQLHTSRPQGPGCDIGAIERAR